MTTDAGVVGELIGAELDKVETVNNHEEVIMADDTKKGAEKDEKVKEVTPAETAKTDTPKEEKKEESAAKENTWWDDFSEAQVPAPRSAIYCGIAFVAGAIVGSKL